MSVKNKAKIPTGITKSYNREDNIIARLTKQQAQARLDWYGEMVPLYNSHAEWFKWAVKRMDELNQMLKKQPNGAR